MIRFFKDYCELWKVSMEFYKTHWFGLMVLEVFLFAIVFGPAYFIEYYQERKREKTKKAQLNKKHYVKD